jgi:hypothetical protein
MQGAFSMATEERAWSVWLTTQQIDDLTGLGEDFGGKPTHFIDHCIRELAAGREPVVSGHPCGRDIKLVRGGFATQAHDGADRWIRVGSFGQAIEAHKHPERFPDVGPDFVATAELEPFDFAAGSGC